MNTIKAMQCFLFCLGNWVEYSNTLADPRGRHGRVPALSIQFLSFSCSFNKFCQIISWYTPSGVGVPPSGKSWIRHWWIRFIPIAKILWIGTLKWANRFPCVWLWWMGLELGMSCVELHWISAFLFWLSRNNSFSTFVCKKCFQWKWWA